MTDDDIEKALSADGQCVSCGGSGRRNEVGHGGARLPSCVACGGTGRDPHAFLRVAQAVGWLLRRERREAAAPTAEPEAPARAKTSSHGMRCDNCGEPAMVGCKGCDIASCDECEEGFEHGGYAKRHALAEITEPWQRGLAARRQ